jgi:hypothetical protein
MAVFRITSRTRRTDLAKRSLRYIVHRRRQEQNPITRTLYDPFGETTKSQAYEAMDQAGKQVTFFRTVISPDPATEDTHRDLDLRLLTQATMQQLKLRLKGEAVPVLCRHPYRPLQEPAYPCDCAPGKGPACKSRPQSLTPRRNGKCPGTAPPP